jgi:hypothetical protein
MIGLRATSIHNNRQRFLLLPAVGSDFAGSDGPGQRFYEQAGRVLA